MLSDISDPALDASPLKCCVACNGNLLSFGWRSGFEYFLCEGCRSLQLWPQPTPDDLRKAYEKEYSSVGHHDLNPIAESNRTFYQCIVRTIEEHQVEGPVIDYGAGWGDLCRMLLNKGFECHGYELSDTMLAHCINLNLPVIKGDIATVVSTEKRPVSAISLCVVFEHLVDHDNWLSSARSILKPGGIIVSLQPTARFADVMGRILRFGNLQRPLPSVHDFFCPPWHTVFFSIKGMKILANRNGFEVETVRLAPQGRKPGWFGLLQISLELVNRIGWALFSERWPLAPSHVFVLRKSR